MQGLQGWQALGEGAAPPLFPGAAEGAGEGAGAGAREAGEGGGAGGMDEAEPGLEGTACQFEALDVAERHGEGGAGGKDEFEAVGVEADGAGLGGTEQGEEQGGERGPLEGLRSGGRWGGGRRQVWRSTEVFTFSCRG